MTQRCDLVEVILAFIEQRLVQVIPDKQEVHQVSTRETRYVRRGDLDGTRQDGLPYVEESPETPLPHTQTGSQQQHEYEDQQGEGRR